LTATLRRLGEQLTPHRLEYVVNPRVGRLEDEENGLVQPVWASKVLIQLGWQISSTSRSV
jgi:hypothetical protein